MNIRVIIPAAGKGTRLSTHFEDGPKAMRLCAGKPLLEYVLNNVSFIPPQDTYIVVGYQKEKIIGYFGDKFHYVLQNQQLGTGHAVACCSNFFEDYDGPVLITFGDMPLFKKKDLQEMIHFHLDHHAACTLMTAENPELTMWARIIRDSQGKFSKIVEGMDCSKEQLRIKELFSGVLLFNSRDLFSALPNLTVDNVQREYYLTEIPQLLVKLGKSVETYRIKDGNSLHGVNTIEDLILCENLLSERHRFT